MKNITTTLTLTLLTLVFLSQAAPAEQTLSYRDLVNRMIDLEQVAVLPEAGETCKQWASWDRSSRYDPDTGKYVNWAANNDGPQFIRQEKATRL